MEGAYLKLMVGQSQGRGGTEAEGRRSQERGGVTAGGGVTEEWVSGRGRSQSRRGGVRK